MIPVVEMLSSIPPQEKSPTVLLLISIIEQQQAVIAQQQAVIAQQQEQILLLKEKVEVLGAEVRRLKKLPPKPKITSNLPKDGDDDNPDSSSHKDDPAGDSGEAERDPPNPASARNSCPSTKQRSSLPKIFQRGQDSWGIRTIPFRS